MKLMALIASAVTAACSFMTSMCIEACIRFSAIDQPLLSVMFGVLVAPWAWMTWRHNEMIGGKV